MSFTQSANNIGLVDGHILQADVRDAQGNWVNSQIDLDQFIGNTDGWFMWDGENFSQSATNIELKGAMLTAELTKADGDYRDRQAIDLNDRIGNDNGELVYL